MTLLLDDYLPIVGQQAIDHLLQIAAPLRGKRVVHINSTKVGGGVAEILVKMDPLMQLLGLDSRWEIIQGTDEFYQCTKSFHNALQGNKTIIPSKLLSCYENVNAENARHLGSVLHDADYVFIHDPQPCALIEHFPHRKGKWIWRCHIDASNPDRTVWNYLKKWITKYDATIFTLADYTHQLPRPIYLIPPSIDPLSPKNIKLSHADIEGIYPQFGLDAHRPMILQVSRFDRFKDPIGVIEAYRIAKKIYPELQLVLAGGTANDDPEGEAVLQEVKYAADNDADIKILLLPPDAHTTINALQRAADIVIQKSLREGFGLTVTEALWKGKPVIGGNVGGIRLQVRNNETGFLVDTPEGAAESIRYLISHPELCRAMGENGRELVRNKFLITRQLREYLTLLLTLEHADEDRLSLDRLRK